MGSLWGPPDNNSYQPITPHTTGYSGVTFFDSDTGFFWPGRAAVLKAVAAVDKTDSQSNLVGGWL